VKNKVCAKKGGGVAYLLSKGNFAWGGAWGEDVRGWSQSYKFKKERRGGPPGSSIIHFV